MSSEETARILVTVDHARENIALIRHWAAGKTLHDLKTNTLVRYAIERAFIALDAAIRDIPADLIDAHGVPARLIAGFRNAVAHSYEDVMDERVELTIQEDLPRLDVQLAALARSLAEK